MARPSRNLDRALLAAGRELLPARGCAGLSVREVAEAAGVNLGMFHYHFKTREAFLRALLQSLYEEMFSQLSFQGSADWGPLENLRRDYGGNEAASLINRMLALDFKITLADNDLPKVIRSCELAGMDVAFPFLSDDMVAFSSQLTAKQKLNGTKLRYFFKEALRDTLPRAVIGKKKHGFGLPFGFWLQGDARLRALALDSLSDLKARHIVRADFIDSLLAQRVSEHPAYHGTMVWVLMMLEQWFAQRKPGGSVSPSPPRTGHESRTCRQ